MNPRCPNTNPRDVESLALRGFLKDKRNRTNRSGGARPGGGRHGAEAREVLEATACGMPLVVVPQYLDQGTGAWIVEARTGTGVRLRAGHGGGVVKAAELARCVEAATSEAVAARAAEWKGRAGAAVAHGGSSDRDLREFLRRISNGTS